MRGWGKFASILSRSLSLSPRSTHTHSVPRERNSRSTVIKILRASAERYSARNRVNMREIFFFFSFLLFPLISQYNLVRDRTTSRGGDTFFFASIASRLINCCRGWSFVRRKEGNLFVRKKT